MVVPLGHGEEACCWVFQGESGRQPNIQEDQSLSPHKRPLTSSLKTENTITGQYIARARHFMQSSTRYMSVHWVPKLLGPIRNRLNTPGPSSFLHQFVSIDETGSVASKQWWQPTKAMETKGFCLPSKLRQCCLQARWWPVLLPQKSATLSPEPELTILGPIS